MCLKQSSETAPCLHDGVTQSLPMCRPQTHDASFLCVLFKCCLTASEGFTKACQENSSLASFYRQQQQPEGDSSRSVSLAEIFCLSLVCCGKLQTDFLVLDQFKQDGCKQRAKYAVVWISIKCFVLLILFK